MEQVRTRVSGSMVGAVFVVLFTCWGAAILAPATPPEANSPHFVDITASAGIQFRNVNSATAEKYLIETMTGGVAFLDFDNDGWLDLYCINGAKLSDPQPDGQPLDKSDPKFWNRLYRNNHDGTFSDVTEKSGLRGTGYGMGVAAADYDNDGFTDLLVTTYGGAFLYHNNHDGTFSDVTRQAKLLTEGWTSSAAFLDYDKDGFLDVFVGRYLKWNFELGKKPCGTKTMGGRAYCHPDEFSPISSYLFKNNGDGTFRDVSRASHIADSDGKALGVAYDDFNGDALLDISVANDSHPQFLFKNNGDGTFDEVALLAGAAYTEDGQTFAGMGTDFSDLDNDGLPDIFTTALPHQHYAFFHNNGDETFTYASFRSELSEITVLYSGWGMRMLDFDNDGSREVFIANSHVMDNIEVTQPNVHYRQKPLLLKYEHGKFVNISAQSGEVFGEAWAARGAAFGDFDNDGDIDIAVSTCDGPLHLLRNDGGNRNAWIGVQLRGTRSNRDGIGAKLILTGTGGKKQYALVSTAGSYFSASDRRVFFGLGKDGAAQQLRIIWPSGTEQTINNPKPNQILNIEEPRP